MANHLVRNMSFENEHHPGCMWSILHVLNFHQWHNVKRKLQHKRHGDGGRHARGLKNLRKNLNILDNGEVQDFMDAEVDNSLIEEKMSETNPTSKISGKARMKKLITEEMSKEEDPKRQVSAFPLRLLRTDSIHYLEPTHHSLPDEVRADCESPTIIFHHGDDDAAATSTWDPLLPNPPMEPVASNKQCEVCGTMNTVRNMGYNQFNELGRQQLEKHALLQDKLDKAKEALLKKKSVDAKELRRDVALHQLKEFLDALEMINVNKELFRKILQEPDSALAQHFPGLQASNAKRGLTKSGSFPVADLSGRKHVGPSKLKYRQKEIGSLAKQEGKLQAGNPPSMLTTVESSEDIYAHSLPLTADNDAVGVLKPDQGTSEVIETGTVLDSTPRSSHELKKRGENRVVKNRFKDFKQRIKHAIKESRREGYRISMDALFHRIPYGRRFSKDAKSKMTDQWKVSAMDKDGKDSPSSSYKNDSSVSTFGKGGLHHVRRTPSLNESLDRYTQLFEYSFSREAKRHLSDRLKLTNEDGGSLVRHAPKALGRILSLPELETNYSLQSEMSRYALYSGTPAGIPLDSNRNIESSGPDEQKPVNLSIRKENCRELDVFVESESQENLVKVGESSPFERDQMGLVLDTYGDGNAEVDETSEDLDSLKMGESSFISPYEQENLAAMNPSTKLAQPSPTSVLDSCFQVDITSPAKFSTAEGSELKPRHVHFDELNSLVNLQNQSGMDSPSEAGSTEDLENVQTLSKHFDSDFLDVEAYSKDEADFNYVRDVLKLLGFSGNEYLGTWYSPDQPVDPSLLEEVKGCSPLKPDGAGHEAGSSCDDQLLFDVINEVLLEIYERSITYWPCPLSYNSHIRPMPMGYHVLEEVWGSVSWYLNSQSELDSSLDYFMARDLAKSDGWMNLQFDTECVGLELEELILDDLLEEVIFS